MASSHLWFIWISVIFGIFSISICFPLNTSPGSILPRINNRNGVFPPISGFPSNLEKRAPPPLRGFSRREQQLNRQLAKSINTRLREGDCIWFVGNSGSYLGLPFDQTKYNMASIPMSSSKHYGEPNFQATTNGLAKYFRDILSPMLQVPITRFVLVDHSSSGKSVDGFRRAFLDMVYYYGLEEGATLEAARQAQAYYASIPMELINIVDYNRRPGGSRPITNPRDVAVDTIIDAGGPGEVNNLVGDEKKHDRVTVSYPPTKWGLPTAQCWGSKTISAINEYTNANLMRSQIIDWNRRQPGGLIQPDSAGPNDKPSSSKGGKKKDKKPPSFAKKFAPWAFPPPKGSKYHYL